MICGTQLNANMLKKKSYINIDVEMLDNQKWNRAELGSMAQKYLLKFMVEVSYNQLFLLGYIKLSNFKKEILPPMAFD